MSKQWESGALEPRLPFFPLPVSPESDEEG